MDSTELVKISNAMYYAPEQERNNTFYKLYSEIMLASDLSQYGHIDDWCLERIAETRNKIVKKRKIDYE